MKAIGWVSGRLRILDQSSLPWQEVYLGLSDYREIASAIKEMRVRGAPAIGIAAAYGLALGAQGIEAKSKVEFSQKLNSISETLASTRPTARNLSWALERMMRVARESGDIAQSKSALLDEAKRLDEENEAGDRLISEFGSELIQDGYAVLTHCNAGSLATGGYGTALGVIKRAFEKGKKLRVYATETRPLLQGARLTVWELKRAGITATLITDSMAGYFMSKGEISCVIVGADRIARNGDVANKIGTYTLAVLAMENAIPFYVAAPSSTIDLSLSSGEEIPIEERSPEEVTHIRGVPICPQGIEVGNPAFDITPHYYISAIITEKGIIREPYVERLSKLYQEGNDA
jgi:methylthioribose-1-phosphate isomerase